MALLFHIFSQWYSYRCIDYLVQRVLDLSETSHEILGAVIAEIIVRPIPTDCRKSNCRLFTTTVDTHFLPVSHLSSFLGYYFFSFLI